MVKRHKGQNRELELIKGIESGIETPMKTTKSSSSLHKSKTKLSFPYKVDYNDHFETPIVAYQDILPIIDALTKPASPALKSSTGQSVVTTDDSGSDSCQTKSNRNLPILYDPYYCNGKTRTLLHSLGFTNVQHEKRDFYKDIQNQTVPFHHILISNPPYSGTHKERCVQFAIQNLRPNNMQNEKPIPFFLLMPNYVACREHFRNAISERQFDPNCKSNGNLSSDQDYDPHDILYVIPSVPYEYEHPEGTGHETSPFHSIWFCGIPRERIDKVKKAFQNAYGVDSIGVGNLATHHSNKVKSVHPRLVCTLSELRQIGAIPTLKRRNPKQRRKEKARLQQHPQISHQQLNNDTQHSRRRSDCEKTKVAINVTSKQQTVSHKSEKVLIKSNDTKNDNRQKDVSNPSQSSNPRKQTKKRTPSKTSIYRDDNGQRKRRRF